ncbi:MAG: peptide deformylase [Deltaproteobacteria bacterium]|nr:peptide deformylase [Deltaproteobacteria bacterium]
MVHRTFESKVSEDSNVPILEIAPIGEPILRRPARVIDRDELASEATQSFIDDLIATMRHAKGAGLAATQVYDDRRICVIEVGDNPRYPYKPKIPLTVLVNPTVTPITEETFANYEGCLSVPDLRGVVDRAVGVKVEAWDRHGEPIEREIWGLSAGTFQHEVDHLDGLLFVDRVTDTTTLCTWKAFERHHREAFVTRVEALVSRFGS